MIKPKAHKFLDKLFDILMVYYDIIQNGKYDYIYWNEEGTQIVIQYCDELKENIMKKYYNQHSFNSFIRQQLKFMRQLNFYGFKRQKVEKNVNIFQHEYFQRDNKSLIKLIQSQNILKKQSVESSILKDLMIEHNHLSLTLQTLLEQQNLVQKDFRTQVLKFQELKSKIIDIHKSIQNYDKDTMLKGFYCQLAMIKIAKQIPKDLNHLPELMFIKQISEAFLSQKESIPVQNKQFIINTPEPFYMKNFAQQDQFFQYNFHYSLQMYFTQLIQLFQPIIMQYLLNNVTNQIQQ